MIELLSLRKTMGPGFDSFLYKKNTPPVYYCPSTNRGGIIACPFRNEQFFRQAKPHPPSPEKGLWRDKQGFAAPAQRDRKAYSTVVAAGKLRRTPFGGKMAIYGWTRTIVEASLSGFTSTIELNQQL